MSNVVDLIFIFFMTKLSVNINKIATLRNARGSNIPNLINVTRDIESFGANGITIHPRPDERHIKYSDVYELSKVVKSEFNIEGNPIPKFIELVLAVKPDQVTLVPDSVDDITSNSGWNTKKHLNPLKKTVNIFKSQGIRTSIFLDPIPQMVEYAKKTGTDRIELYTEKYAKNFNESNKDKIKPYVEAAKLAGELNLGLNAGHDLNLSNIEYFKNNIPNLIEVSIGHALICESLYNGLQKTISCYLKILN